MTPWIQDWVAALESGCFKQIDSSVNQWDYDDRYSALGVLCEIMGCERQDRTAQLDTIMADELAFWKSSLPTVDHYSIERYMNTFADRHTVRYYTFKGKPRGNECMFYIPIDLTGKLDCNASLDLLNGIRSTAVLRIQGEECAPSIDSLDRHGVPFAAIAQFIRDVWPALTFKKPCDFEIDYKNYDYFELRRI